MNKTYLIHSPQNSRISIPHNVSLLIFQMKNHSPLPSFPRSTYTLNLISHPILDTKRENIILPSFTYLSSNITYLLYFISLSLLKTKTKNLRWILIILHICLGISESFNKQVGVLQRQVPKGWKGSAMWHPQKKSLGQQATANQQHCPKPSCTSNAKSRRVWWRPEIKLLNLLLIRLQLSRRRKQTAEAGEWGFKLRAHQHEEEV